MKTLIVPLAIVAAVVAANAVVAAEESRSQYYAFLIGVNDYSTHEDDALKNLSFCVADMRSFEKKLGEIGFKRVYCLTTESTLSLQPTKERIEQHFQRFLGEEAIGPSDLVLVALSGHGLEEGGASGAKTAYFCPADAHSGRVQTLIPVRWFYEQLARSKAGMKLLLVDACRNEVSPRSADAKPVLSAEARGFMKSLADTPPPQGIAALLSCQSGQVSNEVAELGHGVFMHHVLEGLSGKADSVSGNRDGYVSLSELFNYAADQTEHYVATNCPVQYRPQTPILRGDLPNYKLVRSSVILPQVPSEVELSFTIVGGGSGDGKPLEGAEVTVRYQTDRMTPEVAIGSGTSGTDGRCTLKLPFYIAAAQGEFALLVRHGSAMKRYELTGLSHGRSWRFELPLEMAQGITNSIGMKLRLIPAGEFMMGSPDSEKGRSDDEGPQHRVRITKSFYLAAHEVTVGQFREFVSATGYKTEGEKDGKGSYLYNGLSFEQKPEYTWRSPGFSQTNDHPVVHVSWNDAMAFCQWLSKKEGKQYQLPTEAQWEYACRAGTQTAYYHGDDPEGLAAVGNVADGTVKEKFSAWTTIAAKDGNIYTAPVGQFRANGFGLYDMHGNVWEWCTDWYDEKYYANSPSEDPEGSASGSGRVIRGGSWYDAAWDCRAADRNRYAPVLHDNLLGFRVSQVPAE